MQLEIDQELASFTSFQIEKIELHILDLRTNILPFIAFRTDGHITDRSALYDRHACREHAETLAIDEFPSCILPDRGFSIGIHEESPYRLRWKTNFPVSPEVASYCRSYISSASMLRQNRHDLQEHDSP